MVWRRCCYGEVVPFTAMAAVECTNVGLNTLFKAATLKGMSYFVFILYSYALGTLFLLPLPFIFRRSLEISSFKLPVLYRIIILGFIGFSANICAFKGIEYSSPTLSSAFSNLTPAFTFILAVILRMENVGLRRTSSHAKIIGTILSISGALVAVLYKGPVLLSSSSPAPSTKPHQYPLPNLATSQTNWIIGGLLFAAEYFLLSIWNILQTQVIKMYPAEQSVTLLYMLCTTIIAAPVCFLAETNSRAWRLGPDISLVTIIYSGFFGPSFSTLVHTWGLHLKGPVYISIFKPFSVVVAAVLGVIFLGDDLHLGSVLGAIVLSVGFYCLTWGKAKEEEMMNEDCSYNMGKTPLL